MNQFNPDFKESKALIELFGTGAERLAKKLNDGSRKPDISTTQFRKFYEKVLELNDKAQGLTSEKFEIKILPFLKMMNSKVQYAKTRKLCGNIFETMMDKSIKNVNSASELQNFKYFLEAIIGYMPKK